MLPGPTPSLPAYARLVYGLTFLVASAAAHSDEQPHNNESSGAGSNGQEYPPTYFAHTEYVGLVYAHIVLMAISWVIVLPVAVMLSLATSRFTLPLQLAFLATNALGVLLVTIYNAQTPDLYPGNAHHSIGWIITWVVSAHVTVSLAGRIACAVKQHRRRSLTPEEHAFMAVPPDLRNEFQNQRLVGGYRRSDDSTTGSEYAGESLRSGSSSTHVADDEDLAARHKGDEEDEEDEEVLDDMPFKSPSPRGRCTNLASKALSGRLGRLVNIGYKVVDRVILPFGFVAFATGIVTFGRFFEGTAIFGGLAHWIKGGVFFWLGLFNLGRWAGAFADLGWAWNIRPKKLHRRWCPSAEFVESALIFFYGSTNIFLEHLGRWNGKWTSQDLEHISITVLFIGGGMCGMLIESTWIRDLLNTTVSGLAPAESSYPEVEREQLKAPATYGFSLNPVPALVILLLGIMMSSHHQQSATSSMVHKQWGQLLMGASLARGFTYVILFIRAPASVLPSRPPTELLAAFGLIAGGIIFMASSSDTVEGMIHYNLDAMFMYTVTMGLVGVLMAWELVVLAIKGWALRLEYRSKGKSLA